MTERDPASDQESTDALTGDTPGAGPQSVDPSGGPAIGPSGTEPGTGSEAGSAGDSAGAVTDGTEPTVRRRGTGRSRAPKATPVAVRPVRAPIQVVRKSVEQTAALRESLAEKEAEAYDLRVSIEQLRQELSAEREQLSAARRRPFPWLWLVAAVVAVILLLWLLSMCGGGSATVGANASSSATGSAAPATSGGSAASSAPSAATSAASATTAASSPAVATSAAPSSPAAVSPTAPAVKTTPMRWAGSTLLTPPGVPTSGPGVDAPGVDVTYALDADGTSIDVFERLRLASPQPSLTAALPSLSALRSDLSGTKLGLDGLQVQLDDVAVPTNYTGSTWTAAKPDGSAATSAVLRYRLTGAVVRLEPALPGRLAALLTPITASSALGAGQPVNVRVLGAGMRSLTCPTAAAQNVCGSLGDKAISATLPKGSQPVLVLQFDRAS